MEITFKQFAASFAPVPTMKLAVNDLNGPRSHPKRQEHLAVEGSEFYFNIYGNILGQIKKYTCLASTHFNFSR